MDKCICGCGALPHEETHSLEIKLREAGFTVLVQPTCTSRFTVTAILFEIVDVTAKRIENIKGIRAKYSVYAVAYPTALTAVTFELIL